MPKIATNPFMITVGHLIQLHFTHFDVENKTAYDVSITVIWSFRNVIWAEWHPEVAALIQIPQLSSITTLDPPFHQHKGANSDHLPPTRPYMTVSMLTSAVTSCSISPTQALSYPRITQHFIDLSYAIFSTFWHACVFPECEFNRRTCACGWALQVYIATIIDASMTLNWSNSNDL